MDKGTFRKMCMAFVFFIIHDCDSSLLTPLYNPGIFEVVERGIKWFQVPHIHPAYITPFNPCSTVGHLAAQYLEISDFTRLPMNLRCGFVDAMQQLSLNSVITILGYNDRNLCPPSPSL
ncbi:hypothetical protein T10_2514 [Trichinella papuae]|uniref:Uncharacterized protein n=1 Tax=Trichinella papuae TaxID=268474 RepID=A0A0V1MXG0_9BILA|nr:hypothetical protein T10_2514 [Trichinella papuae]